MWALGIIFYQLVASKNHPFDDKNNVYGFIDNVRYEEPAPLPGTVKSSFIKETIRQLLDKNPETRPDA